MAASSDQMHGLLYKSSTEPPPKDETDHQCGSRVEPSLQGSISPSTDNVEPNLQTPAVLVFQLNGSPICAGHIHPNPTNGLKRIKLDAVSNQHLCGFLLSMACISASSDETLPNVTGRHDFLFALRWACRNFSTRQVCKAEKVRLVEMASSKLLAQDFVNQSLYCIEFPQSENEHPFVLCQCGSSTPCTNLASCPTQYILSQMASGERFQLISHDQTMIKWFDSWARSGSLSKWSDEPHQNHEFVFPLLRRRWRGYCQTSMAAGLGHLARYVCFRHVVTFYALY